MGYDFVLYESGTMTRFVSTNQPIHINDQFPTEVNSQRDTLRPIMQLGKRLGRKCSLVQDKLMVNGKSFTVNNLDKFPFDISHLGTERTDTHILFGGRLSRFSNFFTRKKMLTLDGISFCSTEQYYQYSKAMDATNYAVAAEVMNAFDPVTIKHNGNKITVTESWADKAPMVMEPGVHAKFAQDDFLLDSMKITGSRTFQVGNRYDTYW